MDGQEGNPYGSVSSLIDSPDSKRLAFRAENGSGKQRQEFVVVDGKEGKRYAFVAKELKFSPDSRRLLYKATELKGSSAKQFIVVDGQVGKLYDEKALGNSNPIFSPDSKRVAYRVSSANGEGFI